MHSGVPGIYRIIFCQRERVLSLLMYSEKIFADFLDFILYRFQLKLDTTSQG